MCKRVFSLVAIKLCLLDELYFRIRLFRINRLILFDGLVWVDRLSHLASAYRVWARRQFVYIDGRGLKSVRRRWVGVDSLRCTRDLLRRFCRLELHCRRYSSQAVDDWLGGYDWCTPR